MYLLNVSYSQAPDKVEPHVPSHGAWVKKHLDAGDFLFAGPKRSGLGGAILVRSIDKPTLLSILAEDSYVRADVAEYQIIDFDCRIAATSLDFLRNS
jgi:uncharacterized protein YciI